MNEQIAMPTPFQSGNRDKPEESPRGQVVDGTESTDSSSLEVSEGEPEDSETSEDNADLGPENTPAKKSEVPDEGEDSGTSTGSGPLSVVVTLGQDGSQRSAEWSVSTTGSPHAFLLGIPGQGKSVTTRKILRDFRAQGLPALVFDFHGDMAADPPEGASVLDAAMGLPFSPFELPSGRRNPANHASWEVAEIMAMVVGLGDIQRNAVFESLQAAYEECGWKGQDSGERLPSLSDFVRQLEATEGGAKARNTRARLRPLTDFGLFEDEVSEGFDPSAGAGVVVDLSRLGLEQVQLAAGAFLLRKVYNDMFAWPQGEGMRLAVVLDEAHRLARDVTLPRLMKEGRKYGLSVVVASQGIEDFHSQVLENAGTKIVFRTNFPASKKVAGFLRGRSGQDLSQQIEQLGVGEAYVSTPDSVQARKVYMSQ